MGENHGLHLSFKEYFGGRGKRQGILFLLRKLFLNEPFV